MFCDNCGAVVERNSKFCDSCGKTLGLSSCPLCGNEAPLDGYSLTIAGAVLVHVCAGCREFADAHPGAFEKILAKRRESVSGTPGVAEATIDGSRRSERGQIVVKRYDDAYRVAKAIVTLGGTIKVVGLILAVLIAIYGIIFMDQTGRGFAPPPLDYSSLIGGVVIAAIVGVSCYVVGTLVAAYGQILKANLDCAVNSSPFLTDELKAEAMSIAGGHAGGRYLNLAGASGGA